MNHNFFELQLKRLVSAFGEKAVNEEKAILLWRKFKDVADQVFVQVVDNIVLNQRQSPVLDDFIREITRVKAAAQSAGRGQGSDMVCVTCDGSGWFLTTPRGLMVPNAERCDCKSFVKKFDDGENYVSVFSDGDRQVMVDTCIRRVRGGVSDAEWKTFQTALSDQIRLREKARVSLPQRGPVTTERTY